MSFFGNIFGRKTESVLGIDVGSSSIKVVQLCKKGGKAVLETYGELSLGPYAEVEVGRSTNLDADKISEALTDLLRESHTTTIACGVAIPFAASLMSLIEMPDVPQKQLDEMIPMEARKYIPVPIAEVMLDWWIIPKTKDTPTDLEEAPPADRVNKTDVLVVAIHNDTINKFQQIVDKTRLDASFFEIEIFGSIRAVLDQEIAPVMIFDIGASLTKLYIVERGVMRSSHIINMGSQEITIALSKAFSIPVSEAEILKRNYGKNADNMDPNVANIIDVTMQYIFSEANRILLAYQQRHKNTVSRVVLLGGGAKLHGFAELAKKGLQTEVVLGNPFTKTETPAFLENVLKTTGPEFAVAIGLALRRLHEMK